MSHPVKNGFADHGMLKVALFPSRIVPGQFADSSLYLELLILFSSLIGEGGAGKAKDLLM